MSLEESLYGQEMESGREWVLFGGQLLTFPETPVNFDTVPGSSVLQLEQSVSENSWSLGGGPVSQEDDYSILQDSKWSENVDVGESLELFSAALDASSNLIEKDSALHWLREAEIPDETDDYLNCIDKTNDGWLLTSGYDDKNEKFLADNCDMLSTVDINDLSSAGICVMPSELTTDGVKNDPGLIVKDLGSSSEEMGYSGTTQDEYFVGDSIYTDSSTQISSTNKYYTQTRNTGSSSKPNLSNMSLSGHRKQSASEIVACSHEEDEVDVDLLDKDDDSVFKLLEDLDQECISEDICRHEIDNKIIENETKHEFSIQQNGQQNSEASKNVVFGLVSVSEGKSSFVAEPRKIESMQSSPSAVQNFKVVKTAGKIPKANRVSTQFVPTTSCSMLNQVLNTGSTPKLCIVTSKSGPVKSREMKLQPANSCSTLVTSKGSVTMSLGSTYTGTTIDTTALMSDNSRSSSDSSSFSKVPGFQKYEGFELIPKAEPVFRAIVRIGQPYSATDKLSERKLRKKEQNCRAALRYRQKKREEKGHAITEVEELELQNEKLRSRVEELLQEIDYLKNLMEEIRNR